MIPSSFKQIAETGRLQQQALLAAADRERRALQALAGEPTPKTPSERQEIGGALDRIIALRDRLAGLVGVVLRPRVSQP